MAFLNMNSPTPNISQLWRNTLRNVSGVGAKSRKDGGHGGYAGHHVPFGPVGCILWAVVATALERG